MKLLLTISLYLLALGLPALCWPQYEVPQYQFEDQQIPQRDALMQQEDEVDYGYPQEDMPANVVEEELKRMQLTNAGRATWNEDAMVEQRGRALRSGCRISLKLSTCNRWLACRNTECSTSTADCPAARFQIKRALGNGRVLTGDLVSLHYNYGGSSLFSMTNGVGQKSNCPVTIDQCTWYTCSNEVFQIYAKGKGIGEPIMNKDNVALYHSSVSRNGFVQFLSNRVGLSQCLLQMSGYVRPPREAAFDYCEGGSAEIKIYD